MRQIHAENGHCRPANGCAAHQNGSIPAEMPRPLVPPRIEETSEFLGNRIDASQVRPLMQVILMAGKSQIAWGIRTAMLLSNDVFDVKGKEGIVLFVNPAVFAALSRTLSD